MAYLAIARKWRPQRFEDVVGQGHVTRTLQNAIEFGRVHHAFLFTGARGVGKTTAARILAKSLNCEKGPIPTPCGACTSCLEITAGSNQDVHEIDAASNTGVDSVREIRDNLRYLPASGKHKIYIIDEIHMLTTQAFNALLKTLEEPPPHVIFIFATTDPQKIPDTILSRCQRFDFKRIPLKQIAEKLAQVTAHEAVQISQASLLMIAREAEGSLRDAESLLDQVMSSGGNSISDEEVVETLGLIDRRLIYQCLEGILAHTAETCIEVIEQIYGFGFDMKQFAKELLEVVRHLNVVKVSKNAERFIDVSAEELSSLRALSQKTSLEELSRHFSIILDGYDRIARSEAPRLSLELTLLRMTQVRPVQPLDTLLIRLSAIEDRMRALRTSGGRPPGSPPSEGGGPAGASPASGGQNSPRRFNPTGARSKPRDTGGASEQGAPSSHRPSAADATAQVKPAPPSSSPPQVAARGAPASPSGQTKARWSGGGEVGVASTSSSQAPTGSDGIATEAVKSSRGASQVLKGGVSQILKDSASQVLKGGSSQALKGGATKIFKGRGEQSVGTTGPRDSVHLRAGRGGSDSAETAQNMTGVARRFVMPEDAGPWLRFMHHMTLHAQLEPSPRFIRDATPMTEKLPEEIILGFRKRFVLDKAILELADPGVQRALADFFDSPPQIRCELLEGASSSRLSYQGWLEAQEKARKAAIKVKHLAFPHIQTAQKVFGISLDDIQIVITPQKRA